MRRLLHYLRPHPMITVLAPLFKMLEATFELFVPLVVAQNPQLTGALGAALLAYEEMKRKERSA